MTLSKTKHDHYAECRYAECAECQYAECRYAEGRGATTDTPNN
jgi:hypothetical protein